MSERDRLRLKQLQAQFKPADTSGMIENPQTGQMTNRDMLRANANPNILQSAGMGYMQGFALSGADEAAGAIGGDFAREQFRATDEAARDAHPVAHTVGQVAGVLLSPATKIMGPVRTIRSAMAMGAGQGAAEGFNSGEGSASERLDDAAVGAGTSALFSGAMAGTVKVGSRMFQKLFDRSVKRPTMDTLKATKNAAYKAVDQSGETFTTGEMQGLYQRAQQLAADANFDDIADPQTAAALRTLNSRSGEEMSLTRLDKIRQTLWDRYNRGDEPAILDMIGAIDDLVASRAGSNELMQAARLANSRYAKAQLLENAFRKARLQTAATGSGGNILNKYRQAVTHIITNPKEARWFSNEEISLMERFVEGNDAENVMRRIGKLAPGGNGLMTALNVYAASVNPAMLAITGVGTAAKMSADRSAMQGSEAIRDAVATGIMPVGRTGPRLNEAAAGAAAFGRGALAPDEDRRR